MNTERTDVDALIAAFEPALSPETPLRMEVNLHLAARGEDAAVYVALRVGVERLYVVRNLAAFTRAIEKKEPVSFGKGFEFDPGQMRFERADRRILSILSEVEAAQRPCEAEGYRAPQNGKFLPLGDAAAERLLRHLMARPFRLVADKEAIPCEPIARGGLPFVCSFREEGSSLLLEVGAPADFRPVTRNHAFVYCNGCIVGLTRAERRAARALTPRLRDGQALMRFAPDDSERVLSEVMPQLELAAPVHLTDALSARIRREPLSPRVYIDREGARVVLRVEFQYGDTTIDPFAKAEPKDLHGPLLVRDAAAEYEVLETLAQTGFHVGGGQVYLENARRVLQFVTEGVKSLQKVAEVFASDAFHRLRPRRPQLSGKLSMTGGALHLSLWDGETPLDEIAGLMQALRDRKKYFRLKDGGFLELSDMSGWEEMAGLVGDDAEADERRHGTPVQMAAVTLRAYRASYLVGLLAGGALPIQVDDEVKKSANALSEPGDPCPETLSGTMRAYQVRGFQWIQALYRLRMGGVLADDMGLGKTLQVIAAMIWAKRRDGAQISLVVSPTSLLYNWQAELARFAPELTVAVIEGSQSTRFKRWMELSSEATVDVVITSYPLLRRDINLIAGIPFRFITLDEAQHIKNPQSLSAVAAGRLDGRTRLALTGTPMENNPGELWSIFHYALPGYLATLPQFMRRHGDGGGLESLRRKIRPFLLRRLKADVLPELPDKIETRVLADMPQQQRNVYAASVMRLRERVERVLGEKGMSRGRMEVLSAITQLRQICCHPALALDGYQGGSGKLEALMEILIDALSSNRRVLLFSQFTSMLAILKRALDAERIGSLYLDGKTPVGQRMELVNRFNDGEGQVFLISLKAGGAGLNLTGADMVIHYDPWWNPAAEDQATDRAHRIGQKRVVQVIRLITRGTIEEQVAKLSERKRALFDAVVTAGEVMPQDLTEDEIRGLFV